MLKSSNDEGSCGQTRKWGSWEEGESELRLLVEKHRMPANFPKAVVTCLPIFAQSCKPRRTIVLSLSPHFIIV